MVNNCYDLLQYIYNNSESHSLVLSPNTSELLHLSDDDLDMYIQQLVDMGYLKRYIRSVSLTQEGIDYIG